MMELITNFYNMFGSKDIFCHATEEQIKQLTKLFGGNVKKIIEFYSVYQPNNIPMLDCYVQLLGIDSMINENTNSEPGKYLSEYGVVVFALTVGGNLLCIDTNDSFEDDAPVLIADANFCSYNKAYDCIEIGVVPYDLLPQLMGDGVLRLNYDNIKKFLPKVESSFLLFMNNLSCNYYNDIEDFLV